MVFPSNVPEETPSPRVQELEQRLALTIAEFQQRYPDASQAEILQAAQLATRQVDARHGAQRRAAAAAGAGIVAVGLGIWFAAGPAGSPLPLGAIAVGIAVVVAIVAVVNRRS